MSSALLVRTSGQEQQTMYIENALKIVQIVFYIVAATIATLTYLRAKNGLLNTVNTEYHKKVIERLSQLSDDLFSEFDPGSDNYWIKDKTASELIDRIHGELDKHRSQIIAGTVKPSDICGTPVPKKWHELRTHLERIKSDPFIPNKIRDLTTNYLSGRINAITRSAMEESNNYMDGLAKGKYWDTIPHNAGWFHNRLLNNMKQDGFGIEGSEQKVIAIREAIKKYFEAYNPVKI
jgi:hypothetical protein